MENRILLICMGLIGYGFIFSSQIIDQDREKHFNKIIITAEEIDGGNASLSLLHGSRDLLDLVTLSGQNIDLDRFRIVKRVVLYQAGNGSSIIGAESRCVIRYLLFQNNAGQNVQKLDPPSA